MQGSPVEKITWLSFDLPKIYVVCLREYCQGQSRRRIWINDNLQTIEICKTKGHSWRVVAMKGVQEDDRDQQKVKEAGPDK